MIGTTELILIAGVVLLLFGGKKLPELMRGMGQGIKSFKEGLNSPVEKEEGEEEDPEPSETVEQDEMVMSIPVQYSSHRFFILTRRRYFALPRFSPEILPAVDRLR